MISHAITPYFKEREAKPVTFTHISSMGRSFNMFAYRTTEKEAQKIFEKIERSNWLKSIGSKR